MKKWPLKKLAGGGLLVLGVGTADVAATFD